MFFISLFDIISVIVPGPSLPKIFVWIRASAADATVTSNGINKL